AVYASPRALLRRTQDSLPAVGHFAGRDWLPAGFPRKVSELLPTSHPPFSSFPGAMSVHFSLLFGPAAWPFLESKAESLGHPFDPRLRPVGPAAYDRTPHAR